MIPYYITCCSTVDLPLAYLEKREVPLAYFHVQLDGKDIPDDMGKTIPFEEYFARIAAGAAPTTSQVNVEQFCALFEPLLQDGKDVLHISLSSGISGAYTSACIAAEELRKKYPKRQLYVVDSLAASSGYGLLVDRACDLRDGGMSIDQAQLWLEKNKLRVHHWFFSTDLTSYKRGGRISPAAATFGMLLGICPLLNVDVKGRLVPREKIRGKKRVIQEIVRMMQKHAEDGAAYHEKCFLSESACLEDAKQVTALIEKAFPQLNGPVLINSIGMVIGAHTGPGTVALFFWGDPRTD